MDYATNPELRAVDPVAEHHIAGIFSIPLHYDVDALSVVLTPSGRIADSAGYSSLGSNYARLMANAVYSTERDTFALQAGLSRDSSLYETGQIANGYGLGVRRDSTTTSADWDRSFTARTQFDLNVGWSRVRYDQPADTTNLIDYRYYSANPTLSYAVSERDSVKLLGGFGRYESLNGETYSNTGNMQLGFTRQLTEVWTLSANVGYSRTTTQNKIFFGDFYLGTINGSQNGTVYGVNLTRTGESFNFQAGVSRTLQPFGSYGLSRTENLNASASYTYSERWTFSLATYWIEELDPTQINTSIDLHYFHTQLQADWHVRPQWLISFRIAQDSRKFGSDVAVVDSTGAAVDIVRQFLRSQF